MQDFEILDQQDSIRTIQLANGNKLNLKRTDPYGFWSIHYDKGQVPRELTGSYTSADRALEAVDGYLKTRNIEVQAEAQPKEVGNKKKN